MDRLPPLTRKPPPGFGTERGLILFDDVPALGKAGPAGHEERLAWAAA
jgi:hypothetical protein